MGRAVNGPDRVGPMVVQARPSTYAGLAWAGQGPQRACTIYVQARPLQARVDLGPEKKENVFLFFLFLYTTHFRAYGKKKKKA